MQLQTTPVGNMVVTHPAIATIFDQYQIDYWCLGHNTLQEIAKDQQFDLESLLLALEKALQSQPNQPVSKLDLVATMKQSYHPSLREKLPTILSTVSLIKRVHGKHHPELSDVHRLVQYLAELLEQQMVIEETLFFPALLERNPIGKFRSQQQSTDEEINTQLKKIRLAANQYEIPNDVCGTYVNAYQMLEALEQAIHHHLHQVNNSLLVGYDVE